MKPVPPVAWLFSPFEVRTRENERLREHAHKTARNRYVQNCRRFAGGVNSNPPSPERKAKQVVQSSQVHQPRLTASEVLAHRWELPNFSIRPQTVRGPHRAPNSATIIYGITHRQRYHTLLLASKFRPCDIMGVAITT